MLRLLPRMSSLLFSTFLVHLPSIFSQTFPEFFQCRLWLTQVPVWASEWNRLPCLLSQTTYPDSRVECLRNINRLQNKILAKHFRWIHCLWNGHTFCVFVLFWVYRLKTCTFILFGFWCMYCLWLCLQRELRLDLNTHVTDEAVAAIAKGCPNLR